MRYMACLPPWDTTMSKVCENQNRTEIGFRNQGCRSHTVQSRRVPWLGEIEKSCRDKINGRKHTVSFKRPPERSCLLIRPGLQFPVCPTHSFLATPQKLFIFDAVYLCRNNVVFKRGNIPFPCRYRRERKKGAASNLKHAASQRAAV